MSGENTLFCKIFENCFSEMKSLKIDRWQLGYDTFLTNFNP